MKNILNETNKVTIDTPETEQVKDNQVEPKEDCGCSIVNENNQVKTETGSKEVADEVNHVEAHTEAGCSVKDNQVEPK